MSNAPALGSDCRSVRSNAPGTFRSARTEARALSGRFAAAALGAGLTAVALIADAAPEASATGEHVNYSVGYAFGEHLTNLRRQGVAVDPEAIFRGMLDALAGVEAAVSREDMRKALDALQEPAVAGDGQQQQSGAARAPLPPARTRGYKDDFARLNAQRPGVVTLPSGLQYEVLEEGKGRTPGPTDRVAISYEATLSNGVGFDSSGEDGPFRIGLDEIAVPGLKEALLLMHEGDKWRVVIPPHLGFGSSPNNVLRKRDLIYEIELVAVEPSEQAASSQQQSANGSEPAQEPAAGTPE